MRSTASTTATIYDGTKLAPGHEGLIGPAVVEDPGTTIVVHPGNRAHIDGFGNLHIDALKGASHD
jgi:N-methylhydantoinase A